MTSQSQVVRRGAITAAIVAAIAAWLVAALQVPNFIETVSPFESLFMAVVTPGLLLTIWFVWDARLDRRAHVRLRLNGQLRIVGNGELRDGLIFLAKRVIALAIGLFLVFSPPSEMPLTVGGVLVLIYVFVVEVGAVVVMVGRRLDRRKLERMEMTLRSLR